MTSLVYEGYRTKEHKEEIAKLEKFKSAFNIDGFEFEKAQVDPKTNTIKVHSLLNTLMIAVASSTDPKVREVLSKAGIQINDLKGKSYFPR